ncbi:SRPBCC family protein [Azotobacter chroococcum]|uniref:SRPBCC family protein n=1 Tax=Azotobacter chroococcum TaxID=353 RepID=A0AAQ0C1P2_9GAMM|nr:XoxI [Azotobacter chroococcum]QQE91259.1 SRPBCC family protein [Azotobacter chroococcum]TBV92412.1 SRPBCC family protein [Azotobacter chroococcum]TKD33167.1 SRPBCC family protein [Azotobacter chroococcum]
MDVSVSISIARPAEQVWLLLGGFDLLPRWVDSIASSRLDDGGRLRYLEMADGVVIIERLLEFSESERHYSYALLEGPLPVSDYLGRVSVRDDGEGRSLATWSSRFRSEKANEVEIATDLESFYRTGLERLKAMFEAQQPVTGAS